MAGQPQQETQYGVTKPLSVAPPSERDLKLNELLTQELKAQKNFPSEDDKNKKEKVIKDLKILLRRMVQQVGQRKGLPASILEKAGGEVYTYGSHRLGVFQNGSDIDALMVAPKHCSREDFFEIMPIMLKETPELGDVTEPNAVPGISVPIIKVEIEGVDIDLIFCSLGVSSIPDNFDLNDMNLLRGLDATDLRCINGTRVTNRIIDLVPQRSTFRLALRAIKLWANRRALYGNIVGFPGGVAYAMMVARICQLYPMAAAPLIVQKFFFIMKKWQWPMPVRLQAHESGPLQLREWNPEVSRADKAHLMPVITPAYPVANSTHTITESTKKVIIRELHRGDEIVADIYAGKSEWKALFQRHTFFTSSYRHFICVITGSKNEAEQKSWTGLVLSKLKILAGGIEHSDGRSVELVQPYNKGFDRVHACKTPEDVEKTLDGDLSCQITETKETEQAAVAQAAAQADAESTAAPTTNGIESKTVDGAANVDNSTAAEASKENAAPTNGLNGETKPEVNGETKTEAGDQTKVEVNDEAKKNEVQKIYTTTYYLGIGLVKGANSLDLSGPIQTFKDICLSWEKYDQDVNSVRIKYMKGFDLPADVFVEGETRPQRAKKGKGKRTGTNAEMDDNADAKRRQTTNGSTPTGKPMTNGTKTAAG